MNTVKKGDKFEAKSIKIIRKLIDENSLGISDFIEIFSKKKYFSIISQSNIEFDLVIEVKPPGAKRPVLTYFIECKDYKTRVPVNRIRDFHDRIRQVSGVNSKGIFITNSPLQSGAYTTAESYGMMVIYGESCEDFKIILHKTSRTKSNVIPFVEGTIDGSVIDEGVKYLEKIIDSSINASFHEIVNESRVGFGIDKLSKVQIEKFAELELDKINPNINLKGHDLRSSDLKECLVLK